MIVISDTSPLLALWKIGQLELLPRLYGGVFIPAEVELELRDEEHSASGTAIFQSCAEWLKVRAAKSVITLAGLDSGESAAIALAQELGADLLLIDERFGRRIALEYGLAIRGTVGVLEDAASRGLIDLSAAFELLKATDFRISAEFLDSRLKLHEQQ